MLSCRGASAGRHAIFTVTIKRIYAKPAKGDGYRVLVDRVWPRGVSKDKAAVDQWMKEIAPSTDLRKWFGHDPEKWAEFERCYREELKKHRELIEELRGHARKGPLTLVYAAKDEAHNQAVVLKAVIEGK